jgi:Arc/MetJ-type ribon-helix-helix transcriptional regulator
MSVDRNRSVESKVTIKIPRKLYNRLAEIVSDSGFNSVTDFVVYVLRDLASAKEMSKSERVGEESLTKEEVEQIRKRLKSLGYL